MQHPQPAHDALWRARFRTPSVLGTQIAAAVPARGIAVTNRTCVYQLYAWDVPTGALSQRTDAPQGVLSPGAPRQLFATDRLTGVPMLWTAGEIAVCTIVHRAGARAGLLRGTPAERPDIYAARSPNTYVDSVVAPVLIIQGRNDTRAPARPLEQYEARMRAQGTPIEVVWFETVHQGSYAQVDLRIEHRERMLRFVQEVLQ